MNSASAVHQVLVVGAGLAGAVCARTLADAGVGVVLADKARGVGGRLATRRAPWLDAADQARQTAFDHGAPAFAARDAGFRRVVAGWEQAGWVARWVEAGIPGEPAWLAQPDQPSLCRRLIGELPVQLSQPVESLQRDTSGRWQAIGRGAPIGPAADAVVLAIPPAQAAPLLAPHRPDWAAAAEAVPMQPGWTLMAVVEGEPAGWTLRRPADGPLAWVHRNDRRPGRTPLAGESAWVAHARADWSRAHLEDDGAAVQAVLQQALAGVFGAEPIWRHAIVHRWRYAQPAGALGPDAEPAWWDGGLRLGAAGDWLGRAGEVPGSGVESAWRSGRALARALLGEAGAAR